MSGCPKCGNADHPAGMEISAVYDGVLYWFCERCGWAWNRWESGTRRHEIAQSYVDVVNMEWDAS